MKNIHISLTEFRNESRVLKEISSLEVSGLFDSFGVIALGAEDLKEKEEFSTNATAYRIRLQSRRLPRSVPFQLIKFIELMFKCFLMVKREKADVVNLHTLALLPLGWILKKFLHVKLVYDTHELETEVYEEDGIRKTLSKIIEKIFIRKVDLMFVVSQSIADWYEKEYKIRKPEVILNSPRLFNLKKTNLLRENLKIKKESIIVLYQGGLSEDRGVHVLLDCFKQRNDDKVVIVFMGYGELEESIKTASKKYDNIFFHPAVPTNVVLKYTSSADIGIHIIKNACLNNYFCMPNKLFEYAMVGLPVVVSNMKEMRETVEKYKMGIVVNDETTASVNQAIDKILRLDLVQIKRNARQCAEENSWEKQEIKMINEYKRMLYAK